MSEGVAPIHSVRQTGRRVLVNMGALAGSSLWRIAVMFVLVVMVTRRLGVAGVGHYTIALTYLNVCQVLTELGLPTLLIRDLAQTTPQATTQWRKHFFVALRWQGGASFVIWGALYLLTQLWPFTDETRNALWVVGASLPFYAVTSVCQTLFQAAERMELVMGIEVLINTLIVGISLVVLWWGGSVVNLMVVLIATQAISALLCLLLVVRYRLLTVQAEPTTLEPPTEPPAGWRLVRQAAPFYGLALADVLLQRLDILLLSLLAGPNVTGIYSLAYNVVRVLNKLIQSYWRALYPTLSRLYRQARAQYGGLAWRSLRYGFILLALSAAIGTQIAPQTLTLLFGAEAAVAAPVLRVLLWSAPIFLIEMYVITLLMIEQHPQASLLVMTLHLVTLTVGGPLLIDSLGAPGMAWIALLSSLVGASSGLLIISWRGMRTVPTQWRQLLVASLAATLCATVIAELPIFNWVARALIASGAFCLILWWMKAFTRTDLETFRKVLGVR